MAARHTVGSGFGIEASGHGKNTKKGRRKKLEMIIGLTMHYSTWYAVRPSPVRYFTISSESRIPSTLVYS